MFTPAVLLMCWFFDYIFKSCQSFSSTEICIWSYFMEQCRQTNYNIWLPTCYSLWKRTKKYVAVLHRSNLIAFFVLYMIRELKEYIE